MTSAASGAAVTKGLSPLVGAALGACTYRRPPSERAAGSKRRYATLEDPQDRRQLIEIMWAVKRAPAGLWSFEESEAPTLSHQYHRCWRISDRGRPKGHVRIANVWADQVGCGEISVPARGTPQYFGLGHLARDDKRGPAMRPRTLVAVNNETALSSVAIGLARLPIERVPLARDTPTSRLVKASLKTLMTYLLNQAEASMAAWPMIEVTPKMVTHHLTQDRAWRHTRSALHRRLQRERQLCGILGWPGTRVGEGPAQRQLGFGPTGAVYGRE